MTANSKDRNCQLSDKLLKAADDFMPVAGVEGLPFFNIHGPRALTNPHYTLTDDIIVFAALTNQGVSTPIANRGGTSAAAGDR